MPTRRELFQQLTGALVINGVPILAVDIVPADRQPVLAIVEIDAQLSLDQVNRIKQQFEAGIRGTPCEGMKWIILAPDMHLTLFDRFGGVCQQRIDDWLKE
jgi:hypothetical protein